LSGKRHFVEGIGFGLISRMIAVLDDIDSVSVHEWKKASHKLHRDACVAAALAHEMAPVAVKLSIDGRNCTDEYLLLEILNIRRAGPAVEFASEAQFADGKLDIVTVTADQRARLLQTLKDRLADKTPRALTTRRGRAVRFSPAADCELRIDDQNIQLAAGDRVDVSLLRGALELVLPGR
jgi:diacylglycerol kinase family enzyme